MTKLKSTCDICEKTEKFPPPETWDTTDLTLCNKCRWPQIGNGLIGVFGFSNPEEAAIGLRITKSAIHNLNYQHAGESLRVLARHVVQFAANLPKKSRQRALEKKCPWTNLSERLREIFDLPRLLYLRAKFDFSESTITRLNTQNAGKTLTRMMEILLNLAEMLMKNQRESFLRNKNFFLD